MDWVCDVSTYSDFFTETAMLGEQNRSDGTSSSHATVAERDEVRQFCTHTSYSVDRNVPP